MASTRGSGTNCSAPRSSATPATRPGGRWRTREGDLAVGHRLRVVGERRRFGCAHIGRVGLLVRHQELRGGRKGRSARQPHRDQDGPTSILWGVAPPRPRTHRGHRRGGDTPRRPLRPRAPLGPLGGGQSHPPGRRRPPYDTQPRAGCLPGHRRCGGTGTVPPRGRRSRRCPAPLRGATRRKDGQDREAIAAHRPGRPAREPPALPLARSSIGDDPLEAAMRQLEEVVGYEV